MIVFILLIVIPVLLLGALILMFLARKIGGIKNANFINSLVVCLIAGALVYVSFLPIGLEEILDLGIGGVMGFLVLVQTIAYTVAGKYVWKTDFVKSLKAISVPMIIQSILLAYALNKINEFISSF
tara:strand:- start:798 stop:1175 length:378 start_codon:yes stop_codon:yes gene_type:complete